MCRGKEEKVGRSRTWPLAAARRAAHAILVDIEAVIQKALGYGENFIAGSLAKLGFKFQF